MFFVRQRITTSATTLHQRVGTSLPPRQPRYLINSKTVFLSKLTLVFLSTLVPLCLFYYCHLNQAAGCPENWQELEITQDSGEVAPSIPSSSSTLTNHSPPIHHQVPFLWLGCHWVPFAGRPWRVCHKAGDTVMLTLSSLPSLPFLSMPSKEMLSLIISIIS